MAASASVSGNNAVAIQWTSGAPAAAKLNVYRALGTCAAHDEPAPVAAGVTASSHLDTGVSGTLTWAYHVTATGPCTASPKFAGLANTRTVEACATVNNTVFSDSFESGETSRWSPSPP